MRISRTFKLSVCPVKFCFWANRETRQVCQMIRNAPNPQLALQEAWETIQYYENISEEDFTVE